MPPTQYDYLIFLFDRIPRWLADLSAINCDCTHPCLVHSQPLATSPPPLDPADPTFQAGAISAITFATTATADTTSTYDRDRPTAPIMIGMPHCLQNAARKKRRSSSVHSVTGREIASAAVTALQGAGRYRIAPTDGIIVEYDAKAQQVLLRIVEDISRGRGLIRRARAQARTHSFCHSANQEVDEDDDLDDDTVMTQVRLRRKRTNEVSSGGDDALRNLQTCEHTDEHLHKGQDLCAAAAFQLLRDGECRVEIKKAQEALEDAFARVQQALLVLEEKGSASPLGRGVFDRAMLERRAVSGSNEVPSVRVQDVDGTDVGTIDEAPP